MIDVARLQKALKIALAIANRPVSQSTKTGAATLKPPSLQGAYGDPEKTRCVPLYKFPFLNQIYAHILEISPL